MNSATATSKAHNDTIDTQPLKEKAKDAANNVKDKANEAKDTIKDKAADAKESVSDKAKEIKDTVVEKAHDVRVHVNARSHSIHFSPTGQAGSQERRLIRLVEEQQQRDVRRAQGWRDVGVKRRHALVVDADCVRQQAERSWRQHQGQPPGPEPPEPRAECAVQGERQQGEQRRQRYERQRTERQHAHRTPLNE
jgi:hypothetical protein